MAVAAWRTGLVASFDNFDSKRIQLDEHARLLAYVQRADVACRHELCAVSEPVRALPRGSGCDSHLKGNGCPGSHRK